MTQAEQIHSIREWANVRAVAATPREDRKDYKQEPATIGTPDPQGEDIREARGGRAVDF